MGATLLDSESCSPLLVRQALGHFATGVTVVTSRTSDGTPVGTTVSAVSSLSLAPPLLLVCLDRASQTLAAIREQAQVSVADAHIGATAQSAPDVDITVVTSDPEASAGFPEAARSLLSPFRNRRRSRLRHGLCAGIR